MLRCRKLKWPFQPKRLSDANEKRGCVLRYHESDRRSIYFILFIRSSISIRCNFSSFRLQWFSLYFFRSPEIVCDPVGFRMKRRQKTDLCEKREIPVSSDFFSALFLSDINKISDGSADLLWMCSCVHNATKQQPPRLIFFSLRFAYTSTVFTRTSAKIEGFFFLQPSYRLTVETNQI